jgi:hypothetical protein
MTTLATPEGADGPFLDRGCPCRRAGGVNVEHAQRSSMNDVDTVEFRLIMAYRGHGLGIITASVRASSLSVSANTPPAMEPGRGDREDARRRPRLGLLPAPAMEPVVTNGKSR